MNQLQKAHDPDNRMKNEIGKILALFAGVYMQAPPMSTEKQKSDIGKVWLLAFMAARINVDHIQQAAAVVITKSKYWPSPSEVIEEANRISKATYYEEGNHITAPELPSGVKITLEERIKIWKAKPQSEFRDMMLERLRQEWSSR